MLATRLLTHKHDSFCGALHHRTLQTGDVYIRYAFAGGVRAFSSRDFKNELSIKQLMGARQPYPLRFKLANYFVAEYVVFQNHAIAFIRDECLTGAVFEAELVILDHRVGLRPIFPFPLPAIRAAGGNREDNRYDIPFDSL